MGDGVGGSGEQETVVVLRNRFAYCKRTPETWLAIPLVRLGKGAEVRAPLTQV